MNTNGYTVVSKFPNHAAASHSWREIYGGTSAILKEHRDPRGSLVELWRSSWIEKGGSEQVGQVKQVYISSTRGGVVKGWHLHQKQTDRFFCLSGSVILCRYDLRSGSTDKYVDEVVLNRHSGMVTVEPGFAHGWLALEDSQILNMCSEEYDGTDEFRRPWNAGPEDDVDYDWYQTRNG